MEKSRFQTIIADIENLTNGGKIAEVFPKILIVQNVLKKILSMGMITEFEFQVALKCTGENSPLKISRIFNTTRTEINECIRKLLELEIIQI
jgi:Fe2+ transport system protein FeoA